MFSLSAVDVILGGCAIISIRGLTVKLASSESNGSLRAFPVSDEGV
jgi:hypothetical protein